MDRSVSCDLGCGRAFGHQRSSRRSARRNWRWHRRAGVSPISLLRIPILLSVLCAAASIRGAGPNLRSSASHIRARPSFVCADSSPAATRLRSQFGHLCPKPGQLCAECGRLCSELQYVRISEYGYPGGYELCAALFAAAAHAEHFFATGSSASLSGPFRLVNACRARNS
jgi:hypothetical protein